MTLGEYITESLEVMERFEKLVADRNPEDSTEVFRLFDALDHRDSEIRMYRLRGLKDEDDLPEPPTRVLQIDWGTGD